MTAPGAEAMSGLIRSGLALLTSLPVGFRAVRPFFRSRLNILLYHGVWPARSDDLPRFNGIDVARFHQHMLHLATRFSFIGLDEALDINASGKAPRSPVAVITFDDGLRVDHCLPVLDNFKIRATNFIVPGCIGNRTLLWTHKVSFALAERGEEAFVAAYNAVIRQRGLSRTIESSVEWPFSALSWPPAEKDLVVDEIWLRLGLPTVADVLAERRPYMTWDDVEAWQSLGHGVGLHTASHPFCGVLDREFAAAEILEPARELRERLRIERLAFAYPFGHRLPKDLELDVMDRAGLSCMLGTNGVSSVGTVPHQIERANTEFDLYGELYGRPLARTLKAWKKTLFVLDDSSPAARKAVN